MIQTCSLELVRVVGDDDVCLSAAEQCLPVDRRQVAQQRVVGNHHVSVHYFYNLINENYHYYKKGKGMVLDIAPLTGAQ